MRRAKIICTIGPASWAPDALGALIDAGMDVARLNFAHGSYDQHARVIADLRACAAQRRRPIAILQDLSGPKLRIGAIDGEPVRLQDGASFTLTAEPVAGNAERAALNEPALLDEIKPGQTILLGDGAITLIAREAVRRAWRCEVIHGGALSGHAGLHLPGARLSMPALTAKDEADLRFGLSHDIDFVGLSFVRRASDLARVHEIAAASGQSVPVIAKIEKPEALDDLDAIIAAADGIMVARGDLGVELPLERVPRIQKQLIGAANRAGKSVITATQMLQSMMSQPQPTRAEVSDVATAILDGTDAVLLASETATGRYPVEATAQIARIIEATEQGVDDDERVLRRRHTAKRDLPQAVSHAACTMASDLEAAAILTPTRSGGTARRVAGYRPSAPIIAVSANPATVRRLMLCWGVQPSQVEPYSTTDEMIERAKAAALASGLVKKGEMVIVTAGAQAGGAGSTDLIKAERV